MANTQTQNWPTPAPPGSNASEPKPQQRRLKLPLLDLPSPETDTLIYLSPISAPSPPLRCSSRRLLATGSPVFERLLGPTCQFRLLRRKGLLRDGLPMGIKFVVDLSPPEEGDEAVEVVEKLWCPDEVLLWNSRLEGGYMEPDEEQEEPTPKTIYSPHSLEIWLGDNDSNWTLGWKAEAEPDPYAFEVPEPKPKPSPVSYSPTRHTAAIERVLHILHGLDPQIHTTPMWYTVHKVAIQLECTSAVQDHVISWLYGNLNFIERYPGLVLQIADEVKNVDLFRDAFAILVGTQLLGGRIGKAGAFQLTPEDHIPPEATPWKKNILFARMSLKARLERLYNYVSSCDWLDNALVINEYTKLTSLLTSPTTSAEIRSLSAELDAAIRSDLADALECLYVFSEDPGNPGWMNPWEKAIYDLIPRERQIYSRMYWQQLNHFTRRPPASMFGNNVMSRLWAWEGAVRTAAQEARKQKLGVNTALERVLQVPGQLASSVSGVNRQSILEVRPDIKGKAKADFLVSPRSPTRAAKGRTDTPAQRWKRMSSQLKEILKTTSSPRGDAQIALPPITPGIDFDLGATQLPSLGDIDVPVALPPAYDDTENTLPCYSKHQLPEESRIESTCLLQPLRVKRKSSEDPWDDPSAEEGTDEVIDEKCAEDMVATHVLPRAERIEITNPIVKRRCSVERGEEDDDVTEASVATLEAAGELEVFRISGVYEENTEDEALEDGHWSVGDDTAEKGKGVELDENPFLTEKEKSLQDIFSRLASCEAEMEKANNLNPEAAYWHPENVRARATSNDKGKSVIRTDSDESEAQSIYSVDVPDHDSDPGHLDELVPEITPAFQSLWGLATKYQNQEESASGEGPSAQLGYFNPYPYTSAPDRIFSADPDVLCTHALWTQCLAYLHAVGAETLKVPISFEPTQAGDGQVLVCLREEEWRYLPLWAGGLEDGTGGVFGEFVAPPVNGNVKEEKDDGEATEVESLGSFDDCMDVESMGSFVTGGFSEFEDGSVLGSMAGSVAGSVAGRMVLSESEFGDSDADREGESDVETREESEVESLGDSTEGESEDEGTDDFEDIGWEST